jgi:hypothetical protein
MTTDNVTSIGKVQADKAMQRYKASIEFLNEPLCAASDAVHELPQLADTEVTLVLGSLVMLATQLCHDNLRLLTDIAHSIWTQSHDHVVGEPADSNKEDTYD